MKRITTIIAAGLLVLGLGTAQAQDDGASSMAELLRLIEQGQARDSQEARQREADFARRRNEQQNLLNQARAERSRQERESARLEQLFEDQQAQIVAARAALDERLGALKELFGVLQTVAGDTQGRFTNSLTNIQYPDRGDFLVELGGKMAGASTLASIEDIEQLWYLLQQEITESGAISRFNHSVTRADGTEEQMQIARGGILALLVESPTIKDRINQGGIVGYCIIALGIIGLLIAIIRFLGLTNDSRKVTAQLKRDTASTDNPLGRVLAAYESNKGADTETIELKLSEAALKEMPGLTKGLLLIKVISVVAPLMGLLGTVTGMIKTFQVITLYGAGDPKMMAGGISQALMTTVLGLVVAIPMVLLHTIVSGQSRKVINILQSQSAGLVAQHSESQH
jgi:biopolymer transport protein ExbB